MKKFLIALYVAGAFLTNSYVRQYRWDEWNENSIKELYSLKKDVYMRDIESVKNKNEVCAVSATILWPAYVAARVSDVIVCTNIKVEAPEILLGK
jgi:hypothetical protein